jgi:hypothetical protein
MCGITNSLILKISFLKREYFKGFFIFFPKKGMFQKILHFLSEKRNVSENSPFSFKKKNVSKDSPFSFKKVSHTCMHSMHWKQHCPFHILVMP